MRLIDLTSVDLPYSPAIDKIARKDEDLLLKRKGLKGQKEAKTIKNRQRTKETRKRVKKQPEIKSRISPTQQERKSKANIMKPRTNYDKLSKFKGLFEVLEFKGPKLPKVEK
ncbi:hypothetical protein Tco_0199760 [Tanacetum coccineum]